MAYSKNTTVFITFIFIIGFILGSYFNTFTSYSRGKNRRKTDDISDIFEPPSVDLNEYFNRRR